MIVEDTRGLLQFLLRSNMGALFTLLTNGTLSTAQWTFGRAVKCRSKAKANRLGKLTVTINLLFFQCTVERVCADS